MPEVEEITAGIGELSVEEISARHRKERKELQAKIQQIKKNAPKSEKKKRLEEIARLEHELEERQQAELKAAESKAVAAAEEEKPAAADPADGEDADDTPAANQNVQRVSKAQKRRDKKAREAKEREEEYKIAAVESLSAPKAMEAKQIAAKLKERQLATHLISSDGDCLFNAVRHQLQQHGIGAYSVAQLREETANYIRANKDGLICYMTNPKTGDLLNDSEFDKYCEDVRSTPAWGSEIELKALSSVLKVPIEVLQAEGPPTVHGAGEFSGPNLIITYHRLMYSLGEHYNSTKPLDEADDGDESLV